MRSFTDFIASLPGVKSRRTRSLILEGDLLTTAERRDIFYRGDGILDTVQVVGPDAAMAILQAYRENRLPMDRGENVREAPEAERYLGQSVTLRTQIAERRRKEACVKDISLVDERDFLDNGLLDRIFWANAPKGKGRSCWRAYQ